MSFVIIKKKEINHKDEKLILVMNKDNITISSNVEGLQLVESFYHSINVEIQKRKKKLFKWHYEDVFRKQYAVESFKSDVIEQVKEIALSDFRTEINL
ncbi:hypothetical protein A8L34_11755 [Bacillus sp. FJAT-27264]|uniref:hypothetical protein n=1 Tax=Paenibacillus sp. (strain DSM 101736 / FJAT-27264) TaxID=1850362 RepID=UPI000807AA68|nr:hypothetical protein [Bacillus sp. FJAT-27264]OBZ14592.1 hypothetical protein A8L34_11755 [Bacillus sp. FJAT-27264]